ncbi:MAG TPA: F0F1 ATP synthase subunit B [Candidatus Saccharimonadia bacterium]|nr:F0F1 ATP synthase subunit B [Candidatus Saccharimonadia bacterium]
MIAPISQFADSSSGIGALGIDGKAFIIQLITFLLAFWVLKRYAFTPIAKIMNERRKTIEAGVRLGEEMQKEKVELEAKVENELQAARAKADGIIADANDVAKESIREAEESARQKAAGIIDAAEARIEQDTARARRALEKDVVGLVAEATEAIIHEKVDAKKDAQLIERALKERQAA